MRTSEDAPQQRPESTEAAKPEPSLAPTGVSPHGRLIRDVGILSAEAPLNHRQRGYAARLLPLLDNHSAKEIVPVTFRLPTVPSPPEQHLFARSFPCQCVGNGLRSMRRD